MPGRRGFALQSSVEFLTTYSFVIILVALSVAIIFAVTSSTRTQQQAQCSMFSGFSCNYISFYSSGSGKYSLITLSVDNSQSAAVNVTNTIISIGNENYTGTCAPSLLSEGQEATCTVVVTSAPRSGASESGFLTVNANLCGISVYTMPSECSQPLEFKGAFYTYATSSPVTVFSAIGLEGNQSGQLPEYATAPSIPKTYSVVGNGDWVASQNANQISYAIGTSGFQYGQYLGASETPFPQYLSRISGSSISCSGSFNTSLSIAYTNIYVPAGNTLVFFNAYADNAIEAWYKPEGATAWNSIYGSTYWSTVPMSNIGSNSFVANNGIYNVAVEWANTCGPGLQAFQIYFGNNPLEAISAPQFTNIVLPGSQEINVFAGGGAAPYTYQWYEEAPGASSFSQISGATSSNYLFNAGNSMSVGQYDFYAEVKDSESPAAYAQSNNAVINIGPKTPAGIVAYVPITITNSQSSNTPSNFQQMVTVASASYSSYEASNLQNIEFFYANGLIVNSWLESGNSNSATSTVYWLNIGPQIPASNSLTVYMGFAPVSSNLFNAVTTGEAPQLSSSYAEYDDGTDVFNNYWNFAGTSLPSGWTNHGITYVVNNGITASSTAASGYISYGTALSPGNVIEGYGNLYERGSVYWTGIGVMTVPVVNQAGYQGMAVSTGFGGSGYFPTGYYQGTQTEGSTVQFVGDTPATNANQIWSVAFISASSSAYYSNYAQLGSTLTYPTVSLPLYPAIFESGAYAEAYTFPYVANLQWLRTRAYPPKGVMPSVSFGIVE